MTTIQRIFNFFIGIIICISGFVMIIAPDESFPVITFILGFSLQITGIKMVIYYFRMARHMVGGRYMLYLGIIILDFGMFTLTLANVPKIYLVLYLVGINAFSGIIDVLRSLEARRYEASWRLNFAHGLVNILVAIACCFFIGRSTTNMLVYIYSGGVIYSGFVRILRTFRKTAIVYIQ